MPIPIPIRLHVEPDAPTKPPPGRPCNGCGVCCLAEPCPLGVLLTRARHGTCRALTWVPPERRYRCGVVAEPRRWLPGARVPGLARLLARLARRWISAGSGCDCTLEVKRG